MAEDAEIALVRRGLEAFLRGDLNAALAAAAQSVVTVRNPPFPDAQTYHGHAGLVQAWADWTADFEAVEMEIGEIRRSGREIVVEVVQRGVGRRSGVEVAGTFWFAFTIEDGLVVRLDAYTSSPD